MKTRNKGKEIRKMLSNGNSYGDITRKVGVAASTVAYHARQLGITKKPGGNRYNWPKIQNHIDNDKSYESCIKLFGITSSAMRYAIKYGLLNIPDEKLPARGNNGIIKKPMCEILVEDSAFSCNSKFKKRLVEEGVLNYHCYNKSCMLHSMNTMVWCGEPIVLHLDHINGIRNDNRKKNLRFLCPNCHSQTTTYCGRNK